MFLLLRGVCCLLHILNNMDFEYFCLYTSTWKGSAVSTRTPPACLALNSLLFRDFLGAVPLGWSRPAVPGGSQEDTAGFQRWLRESYQGLAPKPRRKPDLRAPIECVHLWCQSNLGGAHDGVQIHTQKAATAVGHLSLDLVSQSVKNRQNPRTNTCEIIHPGRRPPLPIQNHL